MERDEFFEQIRTPGAPDRMNFVLRRGTNQDMSASFSKEAFESIGYQMHDFFLARNLGYLEREGHGPRSARVEVRIVWDEDQTDEQLERQPSPWYSVDDKGTTLVPVDGTYRLTPFLDPKERLH